MDLNWLEQLIRNYGYLALVIGTFLEGETILIIAGMAAHEGLLDLHVAIAFAFVGSLSGDQVYFLIGRYKGDWLLKKRPKWKPNIEKVLKMLERHSTWLLLTFRFFYGLRNVTSFAVGMSRVRAWKFVILNTLGAMVWALSFGYGGYLFGEALVRVVEGVEKYEKRVLLGLVVLALVFWLFRVWRRRISIRRASGGVPPQGPDAPPSGPQRDKGIVNESRE